jgi:biofilm PGA synthesis protein PgaA
MDLQRYRAAFALTDRLVNALPSVNQQTGSAIVKGNGERMRAELLAGLTEAYGDQLGAAQARFERLLEEGPNNVHARHELANVYRWRGWLDRSMFEYAQVLAIEPNLLGARAGYANTLFDARDYSAADEALAELARLYPTDLATERLEERWRVHNLSELDIAASRSRSTGSTFGSAGYALDTRWFTRPTSYRYRAFVHLHDGKASFPEGDGQRRRAGGGVEYRLPRFVAKGEVSTNRSGGDLGLAGAMDWRIADTWSLGALVELDSDSVPLRGYRVGVEADQLGSSLRWAPNELGSVSLGWRELDLTDDNLQRSVFVDGRYRFLNLVNSKLDATGTVAAGTARRDDVPYFSPLRDSSWWAGLEWQQRLHRRYERSVVQTVGLRSGRYDQAGFEEGPVWQLQYEIGWRLSQTLAFGFGAQRAAQRYDGVREHTTTAFFNVNARL